MLAICYSEAVSFTEPMPLLASSLKSQAMPSGRGPEIAQLLHWARVGKIIKVTR